MAPISVLYALCLLLLLVTVDGRKLLQARLDNVSVAPSNTSFLDSTSSTTTNSYDVRGLITLINRFPQLSGVQFPTYTNDPCYPQTLSWITCSNYPIRRVTALYLSSRSLYGYLPNFSDMDALETIELQGNYLMGEIPQFLGYLPELTYLNLAYNYFTGQLPYSLANNKRITLNIAGNYGLCSSSYSCSPPSSTQYSPPFSSSGTDFNLPDMKKTKRTKLLKILAGVIPASILAVLGTVCACCCRKKKVPAADTTGAATADTTGAAAADTTGAAAAGGSSS